MVAVSVMLLSFTVRTCVRAYELHFIFLCLCLFFFSSFFLSLPQQEPKSCKHSSFLIVWSVDFISGLFFSSFFCCLPALLFVRSASSSLLLSAPSFDSSIVRSIDSISCSFLPDPVLTSYDM